VQYMCGPSGYLCLVDAPSVCGEFTLYNDEPDEHSTLQNTDPQRPATVHCNCKDSKDSDR
jgi:hypothetical protein